MTGNFFLLTESLGFLLQETTGLIILELPAAAFIPPDTQQVPCIGKHSVGGFSWAPASDCPDVNV
jgi:hypothetical protein